MVWGSRLLMMLIAPSVCLLSGVAAADEKSGQDFFEKRIRPVLVQQCYKCHSTEAKVAKGGLRVDSREALRRGGESGPAIVPGKLKESLLLDALSFSGEFYNMPPTGKLSPVVVADFRKWVEIGAPDPREESAESTIAKNVKPSHLETGRKYWSYQPPRHHAPPVVKDGKWSLGDVDRFVLAALEKKDLRPAPDTDRYSWLRRVSFDLTGLPPTPAEITAFWDDRTPQAQERVVDRLLASPAFGERWGRHWLDLSCYADTLDIQGNLLALHAWRYRDYVIESFNRDKPFDQFVTEQLAGDLMPSSRDEQRNERLIATGFLAIGPYELVNGDKAKLRMDIVDHEIDKVGQILLGQTLVCSRCHDHKFDPITQREYYSLAGVFTSTETLLMLPGPGVWSSLISRPLAEAGTELTTREKTVADYDAKIADARKVVAPVQEQIDRLTAEIKSLKKPFESLQVVAVPPPADAKLTSKATVTKSDNPSETARAKPTLPLDVATRVKELEKNLETARKKFRDVENVVLTLEYNRPATPYAYAVRDAKQVGDTRINLRGNHQQLGEVAPRGFMQAATVGSPPAIPRDMSGRLELARWLVDGRNPLTARVFVNRVWHHLFGAGLVKNVDYFGTRGETPSHPELLDELAMRFVDDGWSVKRLVRMLVLSRTYRMSSRHDPSSFDRDPDNRLLWRMNRRRLDADSIRDALLLASGQLSVERGGPALPTEVPGNVLGLQKGNVNTPIISDDPKMSSSILRRRTIYQPITRGKQFPPLEILNVFDFPFPNDITGARASTTIPTQALFLMNSPALREQAQHLARKLLAEKSADDASHVAQLYLLTMNRPVTSEETTEALAFMQSFTTELTRQAHPPADPRLDAWTRYCQTILASNEFLFAG